jgi:hypothetical protein
LAILAFEQLEKDWQSLKRIDVAKQSRADEQRQNLSHTWSRRLVSLPGCET